MPKKSSSQSASSLYAKLQPFIVKEIQTQFPQQYDQYATKYGVADTPLHTHNGLDSPKLSSSNVIPGFRAMGSITMATDATRYTLGLNYNASSVLFYGSVVHTSAAGRIFTLAAPASAAVSAVYSNNGHNYTVFTSISGALILQTSNGGPVTGNTLNKVSGTGDASIVFTSSSTIDIRAQVIGNAQLGPTYYFQPQSGTSVVEGGQLLNVIQSSSYILVDSSNNPPLVNALVDEGHLVSVEYPAGTVVARATIPNMSTSVPPVSNGYGAGYVFVDVELASGWEIIGNFVVT